MAVVVDGDVAGLKINHATMTLLDRRSMTPPAVLLDLREICWVGNLHNWQCTGNISAE